MLSKLLIITAVVAGILSTVYGFLLTSDRVANDPIFRWFAAERVQIVAGFFFFATLASVASAIVIFLPKPQTIVQSSEGPRGEVVQKATLSGIKRELKEAAGEKATQAEQFFIAGEIDYKAKQYKDAAENYRKSVESIGTRSGYLNLGNALFYSSDFKNAEDSYINGLQIAREKNDKRLEGVFLNNLGNFFNMQWMLEKALRHFQKALEISRQISRKDDEANALGNIGIVLYKQHKLNDALDVFQNVFKLNEKIGNLAGKATTLNNIGKIFKEQLKYDEAAVKFDEAL